MAPRGRRLTDLCGIALLKMMPPADQLRAGRMNNRWTGFLRAANRRVRLLTIICIEENATNSHLEFYKNQINSLTLGGTSRSMQMLKNENGKPEYPVTSSLTKWNCLKVQFPSKKLKKVTKPNVFNVVEIANAFSAITQLIFGTGSYADIEHLVEMMEQHPHWTRQLTSFTLIDNYIGSRGLSPNLNSRLFDAINNGMPALQHFAIKWVKGLKMVEDLSVIAQLKVFSVSCTDNDLNTLISSLNRYAGDAVNLKVILNTFIQMGRLNEHACKRIVCFSGISDFPVLVFPEDHLTYCNTFKSLVSLSMPFFVCFFAINFNSLAQLTQLVHLELDVHMSENGFTRLTTVLPSVRALDLSLTITDHNQIELLNLGHLLPNLEVIHLKEFSCLSCRIFLTESGRYDVVARSTTLKCLRSVIPKIHSGGLHLIRILLEFDNYRTAEEVCDISKEE